MADIVRLEENGVPLYIETHLNAVEGLDEVLKVNKYNPAYKTGFKDGSDVHRLTSNVVGKLALLSGIISNTSAIAAGAKVVVATLPEKARPVYMSINLCQGPGNNIFLFEVDTSGNITMSKYRNGGTSIELPANSSLYVSIAYAVK